MTTQEAGAMETLKVAIIGAGWMGHVHARAYQRLAQHWPDLAVRPELVAVADSSAPAAEAFVRAHGGAADAHWHDLLAGPHIAPGRVTPPHLLHRGDGGAVAGGRGDPRGAETGGGAPRP